MKKLLSLIVILGISKCNSLEIRNSGNKECEYKTHYPLPQRFDTSLGGDAFLENLAKNYSIYCNGEYYILRNQAIDFIRQHFHSDLYQFKLPEPVLQKEFKKTWKIFDVNPNSKVLIDDLPAIIRIMTDSFALKFKI